MVRIVSDSDSTSVPTIRTRERKSSWGLRNRAWWLIRRRLTFTLMELLDVLATGDERDAPSNLRKYLQALARAGILSMAEKLVPGPALTSPGAIKYRLEINCGRQAPVWRKSRQEVYDPNTGHIYSIGSKEANDA